jgi:hypothetical protein
MAYTTAGIRSRPCGCRSPDYHQCDGRARKYSALAIDTLVELTKDNYPGSTRYTAATALLSRGYGRPAQSVDLHLTTEAITRRLSDMTDAELAALEARMITISPTLALEHVDEPQVDGDADAEHGNDGDDCGTVQASYRRATSGSPMPVA